MTQLLAASGAVIGPTLTALTNHSVRRGDATCPAPSRSILDHLTSRPRVLRRELASDCNSKKKKKGFNTTFVLKNKATVIFILFISVIAFQRGHLGCCNLHRVCCSALKTWTCCSGPSSFWLQAGPRPNFRCGRKQFGAAAGASG